MAEGFSDHRPPDIEVASPGPLATSHQSQLDRLCEIDRGIWPSATMPTDSMFALNGATISLEGTGNHQPICSSNGNTTTADYFFAPLNSTDRRDVSSRLQPQSDYSNRSQSASPSTTPPTSLSPCTNQQNQRHACQAGCSKTFSRIYDRDRHEQIHLKSKAFICGEPSCKHALPNGAFRRKDHLTQHLRRTNHTALSDFSVESEARGKKRAFGTITGVANERGAEWEAVNREETAAEREIKALRSELEELKREVKKARMHNLTGTAHGEFA